MVIDGFGFFFLVPLYKITEFGKYTNSMSSSWTGYFKTKGYIGDDIFNDSSRDVKINILQKLKFKMPIVKHNVDIQYLVQIKLNE